MISYVYFVVVVVQLSLKCALFTSSFNDRPTPPSHPSTDQNGVSNMFEILNSLIYSVTRYSTPINVQQN